MTNSFVQLRELEMAEFVEYRQDAVRQKVEDRLRRSELLGNILELFFPKMADTLSVMVGGEAIEGKDEYPEIRERPTDIIPGSGRLAGPGHRGEIIR